MISRLTSISALCLLGLALPLPAAHADEIDDSLKQLATVAKQKDGEKEAIQLLVKLQDNPDKRIGAAFLKLASSKNDVIAVAAIQKCAARKEPGLLKKLPKSIDPKSKLGKDRPSVYVAWLKAAGEYQDKKLRKPLVKAVKKYISTEPSFAVPAILSYGMTREVETVEQLLKWADQANPPSGGGGGSGPGLSSETRDNYAKAAQAVYDALNDLTDNDIRDIKTWHEWWDENKKGYEFPDPNKVEEKVDFTKLREHTDKTYGYTVKIPGEGKPDDMEWGDWAGWVMNDPDEGILGGRFQINYFAKGEKMIRIQFVIFNTANQPQKSPEDFVKWWINDWKQNQFEPDTMKPAEPEHKAIQINGRDFGYSEAVGISANRMKSWGPAIRRIYVTQFRHLLLYIWVDMKTGCEDDVRQQCKDIVEQMTFKDDGKGKKGKKKKRG